MRNIAWGLAGCRPTAGHVPQPALMGRRLLLLLLVGSVLGGLTPPRDSAVAQGATATTTTVRNPDGSTRIAIVVDPDGQIVKNVHLCVARTTHTATEERTLAGDPMASHYAHPAGTVGVGGTPTLPAGWIYHGLVEIQEPTVSRAPGGETTSRWCVTWRHPTGTGGLGQPFTFVVDYSGGTGDVQQAAQENLFLTQSGTATFAPQEVLNGPGAAKAKRGEKGHMPAPAFTASTPARTRPQTPGYQPPPRPTSPRP